VHIRVDKTVHFLEPINCESLVWKMSPVFHTHSTRKSKLKAFKGYSTAQHVNLLPLSNKLILASVARIIRHPFLIALVFSIMRMNRRRLKLADVIGGRPDVVMADSSVAGA
jgi:hypothetical protein